MDAKKVYVGLTGRNFNSRFLEHIHDIRYNKDKSKYAKHIFVTNMNMARKRKSWKF
jgi:hypothetical protein